MRQYGMKFLKCVFLFSLGVVFFYMMDILQNSKGSNILDANVDLCGVLSPAVWVPVCCGLSSLLFGILHPYMESRWPRLIFSPGPPAVPSPGTEWARVIRCVALFVGINHAAAKIDFSSMWQLSFSLSAMSVGLWYVFDRSKGGLLLAILAAVGSSASSRLLRYQGYERFDEPRIRVWLPCIFFSGSVTVGLLGKQLVAMAPADKDKVE